MAVSGHMALGGRLDITAVADNLALGDLEGIGDRMPDLAGSVGLTARISGNLDVPHANMDVMLSRSLHKSGNPLKWKRRLKSLGS